MTTEQEIKNRINDIESELEKNPNDPALLNDLGVGFYLIGLYDKAVSALNSAVNKEKSAHFFFNLGNAYSANDNHHSAIDSFLKALDIDPGHIGSLNNLADEYEQSGETDKAHELFNYLVRLQPDEPLSHFNLGNFFVRQNQHIEAVKCYEKAIEKDRNFIDAYYNIAWILYKAKAFKHGLEYAEKGLEIDPSHNDLKKLTEEILSN